MRRFKVTIEVAVRDPQAIINTAKKIHGGEKGWNELRNDIECDDELQTAVHDTVDRYGGVHEGLDFLYSEAEEGRDVPEDWPNQKTF